MISRVNVSAILSLLMILAIGVSAQNPQPTPQYANPQKATGSKPAEQKVIPTERVTNLQGFGVTGRIPKFGGGDYLVNSLIFESASGKIGIGTQTPGSTLSVNGQIETLGGGVKFPDGSVQLTAGVAPVDVIKSVNGLKGPLSLNAGTNIAITPSGNTLTVSAPNALTAAAHDATLTGNGTTLSPLSVVSAESQQELFYEEKQFASFGFDTSSMPLGTVPAGKRLVIEHISGFCRVPVGEHINQLTLFLDPVGPVRQHLHHLIPSFTGPVPGYGDQYVWSQSVRFIVDSGTEMSLAAIKTTTLVVVLVAGPLPVTWLTSLKRGKAHRLPLARGA